MFFFCLVLLFLFWFLFICAGLHFPRTFAYVNATAYALKLVNSRVIQVSIGLKFCLENRASTYFSLDVCGLVFVSRYVRPEGPWQRCPEAAGSSWLLAQRPTNYHAVLVAAFPPSPPDKKRQKEGQGKKTKGKYILRVIRTHPSLQV